jgi:flagellar transcriptional activator FlhD
MSSTATQSEQLLAEVREVNLAYLVLAQHMIRADKAQAMYRLGVSEDVIDIVAALTPAQLMRIAGANQLICRFRFDDDVVWNLLTHASKAGATGTGAAAGLHANILMAGTLSDAA